MSTSSAEEILLALSQASPSVLNKGVDGNRERITSEVAQLAARNHPTREAFEEFGRLLRDFDNRRFTRADKTLVEGLNPVWDGYYQDFQTIFRESVAETREIKFICDDYLEMVLPAIDEGGLNTTDLREIAAEYKEKLARHERIFEYHQGQFDKLGRDLRDFNSKVNEAILLAKRGLDEPTAAGQRREELVQLEKRIVDSVEKVDIIHGTVNALAIFWKTTGVDMNMMVSRLGEATTESIDTNFTLRKSVRSAGDVFVTLRSVMRAYAPEAE
ncbi:hypothetical protein BDN72DRAFT_902437 [Pluteus cervinus]|uniref:Uncharacterized protein n=1 Tax=Pluteus cervinus TaxID=181527 RepID=A0ACD3ABZ7_9AGAR|nr:hypothetical protein BDN72DRAFT_902437 [Pluteus cervinus]